MTDDERNQLRATVATVVFDKIAPYVKGEMSPADVFELIEGAISGAFLFVSTLFVSLQEFRIDDTAVNIKDPLIKMIDHYETEMLKILDGKINHDNKTN